MHSSELILLSPEVFELIRRSVEVGTSNVVPKCPTVAGVNRTTSHVSMQNHGEACETEMRPERRLLKEEKPVQFRQTSLSLATTLWLILSGAR